MCVCVCDNKALVICFSSVVDPPFLCKYDHHIYVVFSLMTDVSALECHMSDRIDLKMIAKLTLLLLR